VRGSEPVYLDDCGLLQLPDNHYLTGALLVLYQVTQVFYEDEDEAVRIPRYVSQAEGLKRKD
jgi:hypothetical protein